MKTLLLFLFLTFSFPGMSQASGIDTAAGTTISTGLSQSELDSGHQIELSLFVYVIGASLSQKVLGDKNIYGRTVAFGITPLIQFHIGNTNYGVVKRFKSEFSPISLYSVGHAYPYRSDSDKLLNRLVINFSYETYDDDDSLDNYSVGVGWLFN